MLYIYSQDKKNEKKKYNCYKIQISEVILNEAEYSSIAHHFVHLFFRTPRRGYRPAEKIQLALKER